MTWQSMKRPVLHTTLVNSPLKLAVMEPGVIQLGGNNLKESSIRAADMEAPPTNVSPIPAEYGIYFFLSLSLEMKVSMISRIHYNSTTGYTPSSVSSAGSTPTVSQVTIGNGGSAPVPSAGNSASTSISMSSMTSVTASSLLSTILVSLPGGIVSSIITNPAATPSGPNVSVGENVTGPGTNTAVIVGATLGGVAILLVVIVLWIWRRRGQRPKKEDVGVVEVRIIPRNLRLLDGLMDSRYLQPVSLALPGDKLREGSSPDPWQIPDPATKSSNPPPPSQSITSGSELQNGGSQYQQQPGQRGEIGETTNMHDNHQAVLRSVTQALGPQISASDIARIANRVAARMPIVSSGVNDEPPPAWRESWGSDRSG
ncbi:hypothetical protein FRC17_001663 [Serendipita sp. 399]|nr:hypothetical protein FRC17_001663 [Serendipita sp. 399]